MINYKINKQVYSMLDKPKSYSILGGLTPREYGSYSTESLEDVLLNISYMNDGFLGVMSKDLDVSKYFNFFEKFLDKKINTNEIIDGLSPKFRSYLASRNNSCKLIRVPNLFMLKPSNAIVKTHLDNIYKYDFMYGITVLNGTYGYLDFTCGCDEVYFKTTRHDKGLRVNIRLIKNFYVVTGE